MSNDQEPTISSIRCIIAGSRYLTNYQLVVRAMELSAFKVDIVLSGTCRGVDLLGERWAKERNIPIERYPADWKHNSKYAGPLRNTVMALEGSHLVCIWEGWNAASDSGAADMLRKAMLYGLIWRSYTPNDLV